MKTGEMVVVSVLIPKELLEKLDLLANAERCDRSDVMRRSFVHYLAVRGLLSQEEEKIILGKFYEAIHEKRRSKKGS
jgi:metal-responsive CopG/Arc/MetJ family transcriptional regulator